MNKLIRFLISIQILIVIGCAGVKVINPNDEKHKNAGTKMLDFSSGKVKVVDTFTCKMDSGGNRFSAVGKSEAEAKKEVFARCQDRTLISFCKEEQITCFKN